MIHWNHERPQKLETYRSCTLENILRELGQDDLDDEDDDPNDDEHPVAAKTSKNVPLVIDLSGVDHVEDLHEDEGCEDNGQVSARTI